MVNSYIPKQGDIIFLNMDPTRGHEQRDFRPGIVISNYIFNKYTKMALVCPITSNEKEFPTHYQLKSTSEVHGSVLCEHIRSIDYDARKVKYVERVNEEDLISVMTLMNACIDE
jgi:mRNA interferase MazF